MIYLLNVEVGQRVVERVHQLRVGTFRPVIAFERIAGVATVNQIFHVVFTTS